MDKRTEMRPASTPGARLSSAARRLGLWEEWAAYAIQGSSKANAMRDVCRLTKTKLLFVCSRIAFINNQFKGPIILEEGLK